MHARLGRERERSARDRRVARQPRLLDTLAWPADATPIEHIHVSQRGNFGRTLIDRDEHDVAALGYVVRYGSLVAGARGRRARHARRLLTSTTARAPQQDVDGVTLTLDGRRASARCAHASSSMRKAGCSTNSRPTPANIAATTGRPRSSARSRYRRRARTSRGNASHEGPLALLPLGGPRQAEYALVWCCTPDAARAPADDAFLRELGRAFGERMGDFVAIAGRASFPLGLTAAPTLVNGRVAIVGNAAQTLHPVAGQTNLGLRDAHTLVDTLSAQGFEATALATFNARRALDRRHDRRDRHAGAPVHDRLSCSRCCAARRSPRWSSYRRSRR